MDDASIQMKPQPVSSTQEVLAGLVERVTFHNAENGFCVLRAKVRGHRELVTAVGHAATIAAGEWITASGEWVNDRTHDRVPGSGVRARGRSRSPAGLAGCVMRPRRATSPRDRRSKMALVSRSCRLRPGT